MCSKEEQSKRKKRLFILTYFSHFDNLALRKMLCKQYLTTFDKVKITGISLIKSVNNNYWLLPQDRIRQC